MTEFKMTEKQFKSWLKNKMNGIAFACTKPNWKSDGLVWRLLETTKEARQRAMFVTERKK